MQPARYTHPLAETAKWVALLMMAALVLLMFVARAAGEVRSSTAVPPGLLPAEIGRWAKPLEAERSAQQAASGRPAEVDELWRILELHQTGRPQDAVAAWSRVSLPYEVQSWRWIALGAAQLELGDWSEAERCLAAAAAPVPDQPLVHYYRGLLRLEQAAAAREWEDAVGPRNVRLASYPPTPPRLVPNSKGMYELAARMELEAALRHAGNVPCDLPLLPPDDPAEAMLSPTVDDLVQALGADRFEASAHHLLGDLLLRHGELTGAEMHLDAAAELGAAVLYGYRELGAGYGAQARHLDAARAYAKALRQGEGYAAPAKEFLENLRQAVLQSLFD